jgi:hypothetical protein
VAFQVPSTYVTGNAQLDRVQSLILPVLGALARALSISGGIPQQAWAAPVFQNGWGNYTLAPDTASTPAGYFMDSVGLVHLRGKISGGTVGAVMFTLPTGLRPTYTTSLMCLSNGALGVVAVLPSGDVKCVSGSAVYMLLDGLALDVRP